MSKNEILAELPKLTVKERLEIRQKLNELEGISEHLPPSDLTDEEKAILDKELADFEENPNAGASWEEVKSSIQRRLKR
jgi:putative addiction module component (TIGR02574 family)